MKASDCCSNTRESKRQERGIINDIFLLYYFQQAIVVDVSEEGIEGRTRKEVLYCRYLGWIGRQEQNSMEKETCVCHNAFEWYPMKKEESFVLGGRRESGV